MPTGHSPLGASGAHRWINCPGSVELISHLPPSEDPDPEWTQEGIEAHTLAAECLRHGVDPWMLDLPDHYTQEMGAAVQVYLDHVRDAGRHGGTVYIEHGMHRPDIHPLAWGTLDWTCAHKRFIRIRDYKHGAGVLVEPKNNPQLMTYALYFLTDEFDDACQIDLGIVQPRIEHDTGPVRSWMTTAGEIRQWARDVLLPAMERTETERYLSLGEWCRFCPARVVCPAMKNAFKRLAQTDEKTLIELGPQQLGELYYLNGVVRMFQTALQLEVSKRMLSGKEVPGAKVVLKKADRQWTEGAENELVHRYGYDVYEPRKLKSPAQVELLKDGKSVAKAWAFQPQTGYTVVNEMDRRKPVHVPDAQEKFGAALAALKEEE